jgi:hypothetical protein
VLGLEERSWIENIYADSNRRAAEMLGRDLTTRLDRTVDWATLGGLFVTVQPTLQ